MSNISMASSDTNQYLLWAGVGLFSIWGGGVRYLTDWQIKKGKCSWRDAVTQIVISGFTGFLGGGYGYEQHYSEFMILAIAGVSGSLGGNLLNKLWQRFLHNKGDK